jgi:hypothetical protein
LSRPRAPARSPKLQSHGAGASLGPSMQTLGARSAQPWAQTHSLGCNPRASGSTAREPGCADPRGRVCSPASLGSATPEPKVCRPARQGTPDARAAKPGRWGRPRRLATAPGSRHLTWSAQPWVPGAVPRSWLQP